MNQRFSNILPPATEPDGDATRPRRERILIVDDDPVSRLILSQLLAYRGYDSLEASSGEEAIRMVDQGEIDLILLDIAMPGLDGFEVLTHLRQEQSEVALPVVMVTSDDDKRQIVRAFKHGANDYITKPIDVDIAMARIEIQMKLRRAKAELHTSQERYALSARGANDGLWDWQLSEDSIYYSPRWMSMLGLPEDEPLNSVDDWFARIHKEDEQRVQCELQAHLRGDVPHFETQLRMRHEDGNYRWMLCRGMAVRNGQGYPTRIAGSLTDITEGKVADALTGLPNRLLFRDHLLRAVDRNKNSTDEHVAVLFLDLDNFKLVNDSLGHEAGDQLLVSVARRLEGCVSAREALVARMGGDEFTILLDHVPSRAYAANIAERIIDSFEAPFAISNGREVFTTASVGISFSSCGSSDSEVLLQGADTAMYEAKANGRSQFRFYNPRMQRQQTARLEIENELRRAHERGEIFMHYQPIVDLCTGKLKSFEALARWKHPRLGIVSPCQFVSIAEETGIIVPLGETILKMACEQMAAWRKQFEACSTVRIGVNVSRKQFSQPGLAEDVANILAASGLNPNALTIEVTESTMMAHPEQIADRLADLREAGVRVSIDDFGTGYSSLASLHRLSLDALKIDRSFVNNMLRSSENTAIVRTILSLAESLNLDVIAEGVETPEQQRELLGMGCQFGQGFFFSRPLSTEDVEKLLQGANNDLPCCPLEPHRTDSVPCGKSAATR